MVRLLPFCLLLALAACGGSGRLAYGPGQASYPEPGPPGDPWRPYIREASSRFSVPQQWIRAVMQQESGGVEYRRGQPVTSSAGAMGLMQLMPATYADMQNQFNLGSDPYEPHDNILAGTAYIRLMYGRYGAPAFLAAYNAGPQRLDDYLATGRSLPNETVNYVASIAPDLGNDLAMTGPLSAYAGAAQAIPAAPYGAPIRLASYRHRAAEPCDANAAYDPDAPCRETPALGGALAAPAIAPPRAACIQDSAYDPEAPCQAAAPSPAMVRPVAYAASTSAPASAPGFAPAFVMPSYGGWAIQVGAYASPGQAQFATTMARQAAYAQLAGSRVLVEPTSRFGGAVLYRARLAGLGRNGAGAACGTLAQHSIPCMIVAPGG